MSRSHTTANKAPAAPAARANAKPQAATIANDPALEATPEREITAALAAFGIQRMTVGSPDDPAEREADEVAEQVMRVPLPATAAPGGTAPARYPVIRRVCKACNEELRTKPVVRREERKDEEEIPRKQLVRRETKPEDEEIPRKPLVQRAERMEDEEIPRKAVVQREGVAPTPEVTPEIASGINSLNGRGSPLARTERAFFETRMGHDFSGVRIHTDSNAQQLARSVQARAFTYGNNVVLGAGEHAPGTAVGRRLMAHELTHVVQQGGARDSGVKFQSDPKESNDSHLRRQPEKNRLKFWWGQVLKMPTDSVHGEVNRVVSIWSAVKALYSTRSRDVDTRSIVDWVLTNNRISNPRAISSDVIIKFPDYETARSILRKRRIEEFLRNEFIRQLQKRSVPAPPATETDIPSEWRRVTPVQPRILAELLPGGKMTYKVEMGSITYQPAWIKVPGGTMRVRPTISTQAEISVSDPNPVLKFDIAKDRQLLMAEAAVGGFIHRVETTDTSLKTTLVSKFLELGLEGDLAGRTFKFSVATPVQAGSLGNIKTKTKLIYEIALEILEYIPDPRQPLPEKIANFLGATVMLLGAFLLYLLYRWTMRIPVLRPGPAPGTLPPVGPNFDPNGMPPIS